MIPKSSKPACDLRCSTAPELELKCETCPGRNELKPMPGMEPLPRFRLATRDGAAVWRIDKKLLAFYGNWVFYTGYNAWIQYERNGDTK